jgi:hypothetical protein
MHFALLQLCHGRAFDENLVTSCILVLDSRWHCHELEQLIVCFNFGSLLPLLASNCSQTQSIEVKLFSSNITALELGWNCYGLANSLVEGYNLLQSKFLVFLFVEKVLLLSPIFKLMMGAYTSLLMSSV